MKITTLPVYSRLADPGAIPVEVQQRSPKDKNFRLSQHQLDTYLALTRGDADVVFNTAMTGDGKSLAAYLRTLVTGASVFAMYPTNELGRDQKRQLADQLGDWQAGHIQLTSMSAADMEDLIREGLYRRKVDVARHLMDNHEVVLSNPDIFHYLAQFFYTLKADAPDKLFSRQVMNLFDLFLFDEFHVFETPQVVAVMQALLLIREIQSRFRPKRHLFLSATPNPLLLKYLERAGFKVQHIDPQSEGGYFHTQEMPDLNAWRQIVRGVELHFWETGPNQRTEAWCQEQREDILQAFFRRHGSGAKGAIIVNSVAAAYRLYDQLEPVFRQLGRRTALNTGFTGKESKQDSLDADLLIATSTVDVGVDFRINFLVFESRDAGTFLQRLGRLGRHDNDGKGNNFPAFEAHALLPAFVCERLFRGRGAEAACFRDEETIDRARLADAIGQAYPRPAAFESYGRAWGKFQAAHVYNKLGSPTIRDNYGKARENLKNYYYQSFGISIGSALREYKEKWEGGERTIVEEAQSFRGGSSLTCGLLVDGESGSDSVKTYDLLRLAANADLTWIDPKEFHAEAGRRGKPLSNDDMEKLVGTFRFHRFAPQYRQVRIVIQESVASMSGDVLGQVVVMNQLELAIEGVDWLLPLNRKLRRRDLPVLLCPTPPRELRVKLYLSPAFEVYEYVDVNGEPGSIALGRPALLLQTAIQDKRLNCGGAAVIV